MALARPLDLLFFARLAPFVVQKVFLSFRKAAEAFKFTPELSKAPACASDLGLPWEAAVMRLAHETDPRAL